VATVDEWPVDATAPVEAVSGRLGSIALYALDDPVAILAVARGAISYRMIRQDLDTVTAFAVEHSAGWCYLGDVRGVKFLNPWNVVALRRIGELPGVRRRVIVVPRLGRWLEPIAAGELATSVADALDRCR
jgi:hypothetical protein